MTTKEFTLWQAKWAKMPTRFNFKIKYKLRESNPANKLSRQPDYAKGFKTGDGKQILDILLPILQNKLWVWAAWAPTALYTES